MSFSQQSIREQRRAAGAGPWLRAALAILCLAPAPAFAQSPDPTELSIEELLEVKVYTASKFAQTTTEAPSAVTIVTAADIRAYGYRTLADILGSVRGLFTSYDRNYTYLGVRGFERPGDYNARVLLLLDGYRINDNIYDTASVGTEFPVDVDLVERIEIVRGPGSSIYGSNAFFAVVNVITRRGGAVDGAQASGEIGAWRTDKERLTAGHRYANGVEWLLSGSRYRSRGDDLFYAEFDDPATNNGIAEDRDGDRSGQVFGRFSAAGFMLTAGHSSREKHIPTASYETVFNHPSTLTEDRWSFVNLGYDADLGDWAFAPRLSYGHYDYDGIYPYDAPPVTFNIDRAAGEWWNGELKLAGRIAAHRLVFGAEWQTNPRQDQLNFDEDPAAVYLDSRRRSDRGGIYVQDEFTLLPHVLLNAGLRFDHYSDAGDSLNPRVGLVWTPAAATAFKVLYGTAFRAPNHYELYYADAVSLKANPGLDPEEIKTYEIVAEHELRPNLRVTADFYRNRLRNLIEQVVDPNDGLAFFTNRGRVEARGAEFELEQAWTGTARLRASYAWQHAEDGMTGETLTNSPEHLAKLNVSFPIARNFLLAGSELQYGSGRRTLAGARIGGAVIANLTLSTGLLADRYEASATVYNVLDRAYAVPGRPEHVQDAIAQDGRSFRVKLTCRFF